MTLITIDGVAMPEPNTYSTPMADMDSADSSYSESGIRFRNRIRQGVVQLELGWRVRGEEAARLLAAIEPSRVSVDYLDPRTNTYKTADMMVEDRSCDLVILEDEQDPQAGLWDIAFKLIQY